MRYTVVIDRDPDTGAVGARSPDVEEVFVIGAPGDSDDQMFARFKESLETYFAFLRERGEPIPQPCHRVGTIEAG